MKFPGHTPVFRLHMLQKYKSCLFFSLLLQKLPFASAIYKIASAMFSAALQILCQYHCCQHEKFAHLDKPSCQVPRQTAEFSNQPEPIIQKSPDCGNAYANAFFPTANTAKDTKDCCQDSKKRSHLLFIRVLCKSICQTTVFARGKLATASPERLLLIQ